MVEVVKARFRIRSLVPKPLQNMAHESCGEPGGGYST